MLGHFVQHLVWSAHCFLFLIRPATFWRKFEYPNGYEDFNGTFFGCCSDMMTKEFKLCANSRPDFFFSPLQCGNESFAVKYFNSYNTHVFCQQSKAFRQRIVHSNENFLLFLWQEWVVDVQKVKSGQNEKQKIQRVRTHGLFWTKC